MLHNRGKTAWLEFKPMQFASRVYMLYISVFLLHLVEAPNRIAKVKGLKGPGRREQMAVTEGKG